MPLNSQDGSIEQRNHNKINKNNKTKDFICKVQRSEGVESASSKGLVKSQVYMAFLNHNLIGPSNHQEEPSSRGQVLLQTRHALGVPIDDAVHSKDPRE